MSALHLVQLSKTIAERRAWELAKELKVDLVTVNPGMVTGPILQVGLKSPPCFYASVKNQ